MFRRILVLTFLVVFLLGGGLFIVGFFGDKVDIGQVNTAKKDAELLDIDFFDIDAIYDKVVYVIVDAMRVDYLNIETRSPIENIHNRFENFNALMKSADLRKHVRFFNLKADFPTLTAFRVRSMMSGENPGLLDVISALAPNSDEKSSTILKNLNLQNKKSAIIGDETWDLLYNKLIHYNFRHGSLDIRNFDDLDDYIQEKSEMFLDIDNPDYHKYNDWNFMVMHYIGVDHIGHYIGIHNKYMKDKLSQMDKAARKTLQMLLKIDHKKDLTPAQFTQQIKEFTQSSSKPEKILFLLFGDHGQNESGGHGGPCITETSAGFFAFSTIPFNDPMEELPEWNLDVQNDKESDPMHFSERIKGIKVLNQIDLVPIISSAVGVPIPKHNLGIFHSDFILDKVVTEYDNVKSSNENHNKKLSELQHEIMYTKILHNNALQMFNRLLELVGSINKLEDSIQSKYHEFWRSYLLFKDVSGKTSRIQEETASDGEYESLLKICKEHNKNSFQFVKLIQGKLFKDRSKFDWQSIFQGFTILSSLLIFVLVMTIPTFNLSMSRFMFNHKKGFLSLSSTSGSPSTKTGTSKSASSNHSQVSNSPSTGAGPLFSIYLIVIAILSILSLIGLYLSNRRLATTEITTKISTLTFGVITLIMLHVLVRFRHEIKSYYFSMLSMSLNNKELRWNFYWCIMVLLCLTQFESYSALFASNEAKIIKFLLASYQIVLLFSGSKSNLRQMLLPFIQLILIRLTFVFECEKAGSEPVGLGLIFYSNITKLLVFIIYLVLLMLFYKNILNKWNIFVICIAPMYVWFNWIENNRIMRILGLIQFIYMLSSLLFRLKSYRVKSKESNNMILENNKLILNRWISNNLLMVFLIKNESIIPFTITSIIQLIGIENWRMDHDSAKETPLKGMEGLILFYLLSANNFFNLGNKLNFNSIPEYVGLIGLDYFHPIMSHLLVFYFLTSHLFSLSTLIKLPLGLKNPRIVMLGILLSKFLFTVLGIIILRENIMVWQILSPKLVYEFVFCIFFSIYSLY
ncbi:phosphatidylinositol glycan class O [Cryptosporidium canis]|nr:phosphatidylinositol glycan class O [Cryptosporidium canis]